MNKYWLHFLTFFFSQTGFSEPIIVKHYQTQDRYIFGLEVLELALSKIDKDYKIVGDKDQVNEARGEDFVINGIYDFEFMSVTPMRLKKMIPVKIPLYRGLLGLRLVLTRKNDKRMNTVSDLPGLKNFVGGHGTHWGDLPVYKANQLKVITNVDYESLFKMLIHKRFDYFHRGINEIWDELDRYKKDLKIVEGLMFFYKHPVYFFVNKKQIHLAKDIENGLKIAISDGSFKSIFQKNHLSFVDNGKINNRKLVIFKNPLLTQDIPSLDVSWWAPEKVQKKIAAAGY